MTWSDMTTNWGDWFTRIKDRFPNVQDADLPFAKTDRSRFEAYLADTHDLTLGEAREELDDLMFVEQLAREAIDFRAQSNA